MIRNPIHVSVHLNEKKFHFIRLSFVTNYDLGHPSDRRQDCALIILRAKHYSNMNEGNKYLYNALSEGARARENGQRQQVGKGEVGPGRARAGAARSDGRPTKNGTSLCTQLEKEGGKEARELLTCQAPEMLCRLGASKYNFSTKSQSQHSRYTE